MIDDSTKPTVLKMEERTPRFWNQGALMALACLVVIIAGMKYAAPILVPFLLAIFISVISAPALLWLRERRHVPTWAALVIVFVGILTVTSLLGALIGTSVQDFSRNLPSYTESVRDDLRTLITWAEERGVNAPEDLIIQELAPESGFRVFTYVISGFGSILGSALLVLLIVFFILLEAATFPRKLTAMKSGDTKLLDQAREIELAIRDYMVMKTVISIATGVLVMLGLMLIGVDYPILWGTVAFLFNFVPNIGSFIAAVPAIALAFLQLGIMPAVYTAFLYLAVNVIFGNFIEPRYMGKGLGLSTLVVILSLIAWGWVLGPVGMLLSVPLTMALKIGLSRDPQTEWIAILLGDESDARLRTEKRARKKRKAKADTDSVPAETASKN